MSRNEGGVSSGFGEAPMKSHGDYHDHSHRQESSSGASMEMITRLTKLIRSTQLDCECRLKLDETLARFTDLERKRTTRRHLLDARERREQIEAILSFLGDLDELKSTEQDHSVYLDVALLFDHVADVAREGADAMRQLYATVEAGENNG